MRIAWSADTHFNFAQPPEVTRFFDEVKTSGADMLVLCGDLSGGSDLESWLRRLELELNLPIRFVLGNHDAYNRSVASARKAALDLSGRGVLVFDRKPRLSWLSDGTIETLSDDAVLIGHDGWYDARAGLIGRILMNDFRFIQELRRPAILHDAIRELADEAAKYFDFVLPQALDSRRKVILATHVPPFPQAAWHNGHQSDREYLPYFCSVCAGNVLVKHMEINPDKELLVLCGHTHSEGEAQILPNLKVLTAEAIYGEPRLQGVIEV
jgi:predicted MPP superfamily phosphohydrolase